MLVTGMLGGCARCDETALARSETAHDEVPSALDAGQGTEETIGAEFDALLAEFKDGNLEAAAIAFNLVFQSKEPMTSRRQIVADILQESALAEHAEAQFILGQLLEDGRLMQKDPEAGLYWLLLAAQQGHYEAQKSVALSFMVFALESDSEEEKDLGRTNAIHWLRVATERGDLDSKALLGELYSEREETREEGLKLLREAAAAGSSHATDVLQIFDEVFDGIDSR